MARARERVRKGNPQAAYTGRGTTPMPALKPKPSQYHTVVRAENRAKETEQKQEWEPEEEAKESDSRRARR